MLGQTIIRLRPVIQLCNKIVCVLAWPHTEGDNIGNAVFQLESGTHIPINSTTFGVISRRAAAISLSRRPWSFVIFIRSVFVAFASVTVVLEAFRIDTDTNFHTAVSQFCNTVVNSYITKAQFRLDRRSDFLESSSQRGTIRCQVGVRGVSATLCYQVFNFCYIVGNTDRIEFFIRTQNGVDLIRSKVKVTSCIIVIAGSENMVSTVIFTINITTEARIIHLTAADTEGRVTVCYEYHKRCRIFPHFQFVGYLERIFPVCAACCAQIIHFTAESIVVICKTLY